MRVFSCAYTGFSVAIPMSSVSALALYDSETQHTGYTYISLPRLFDLDDEIIRHGIILKNSSDEDLSVEGNRIVLLTTEVRCETEINDEDIYPLPKIFADFNFSMMFSGIQFADYPVLLLNTKLLVQNIFKSEDQKELTV